MEISDDPAIKTFGDKQASTHEHPQVVDGQVVKVYGNKQARAREHPQVAYERYVSKRNITFACIRCKQIVTQWHYPSRGPKYCSDYCRGEAQIEQTRERVRQHRKRKIK